jgi:hypothetical protein
MKSFILVSMLAVTSSYASDFSCEMEAHPDVKIFGHFTDDIASIQIEDSKHVLEIQWLDPSEKIEMPRYIRKQEDKYNFAKYYSDFNAGQDIDISIPKKMTSSFFKAFLTIYNDNGDRMVPDGGNRFSCILK